NDDRVTEIHRTTLSVS
ncbi:hypothetical protein VCHENC02_4351B, partial [Vibrio harveyi]